LITVLHPVGNLPASVYWRRRVVAFGAVVAVLVLIGFLLGGGGGTRAAGAPAGGGDPAAATGSGTAAGSGTGAPARPAPSNSPTTTPPPLEHSGTGTGTGTDTGTGSGAETGTDTGGPAVEAPSSRPPPPAPDPPRPCQDSALRLTVRTVASVYRVGEMPVIELTVANVSATTCTRDLGAALQEVLLYAGTTRLWSSNDCYPGGTRDEQALLPREHATFSVTWSGLSSKPRCAGTRTRVASGRYRLLGRIGTLRSAPATLTLR